MITVISGTNRRDSMSIKLATIYYNLFLEEKQNVQLLSLEDKDISEKSTDIIDIEQGLLIPATKFVFIMPEYNASFPGVLKMLLDNSDIKKCWWHKKVMLAGLSDGRAGNLRGIEHMTSILHYLKMHVLPNKIPLSNITQEISTDGKLLKASTADAIKEQIEEFIAF